jgi:hypothetical protein
MTGGHVIAALSLLSLRPLPFLSLRAKCGNLLVPTNCGQELFDVVTVTDERCGITGNKYRILAIQTAYDRTRQDSYTQRIALATP